MKKNIYIYIYICYTKFVTMEKDLGVCVFETLRERERERLFSAYLFEGREGDEKNIRQETQ